MNPACCFTSCLFGRWFFVARNRNSAVTVSREDFHASRLCCLAGGLSSMHTECWPGCQGCFLLAAHNLPVMLRGHVTGRAGLGRAFPLSPDNDQASRSRCEAEEQSRTRQSARVEIRCQAPSYRRQLWDCQFEDRLGDRSPCYSSLQLVLQLES